MFIIEWALIALASLYLAPLLLLLAVFFEYREDNKTAALLVGAALASLYYIFSFSLLWLVAYIPIGLVWSIWRWRVYTKDKVKDFNKNPELLVRTSDCWDYSKGSKEYKEAGLLKAKERFKESIQPKQHVDKLIAWVVLWPVSILERILHDVIHIIEDIVTVKLARVYSNLTDSALKGIDE